MSSTRPGTFPGTTSGTSAAGKQVVASLHARRSPSRTQASTAHCRPCAYSRGPRCSSSRCSRSSSLPSGGSSRSGSLCPEKIAAFPSSAVTVRPTWYSRAVSGVSAGRGCAVNQRQLHHPAPPPVPHRVMNRHALLLRVRDLDARILGVQRHLDLAAARHAVPDRARPALLGLMHLRRAR